MADEPTITSLLEKQIDTLGETLGRRLDASERTVAERFDRQDRELKEIKAQTMQTNGRVTVLEKARERAQGVMFAFSWLPAALTALLTAGLTILIMALTGAIQ